MPILVSDDFQTPRASGRALTGARGGDPARTGIDRERLLSVDGGALRIRPALVEGWGRTCLAYGPFANEPGLAFSAFVLNGHNTSQSEVMADTLRSRLERWARGSGAVPVGRRLRRWLVSGRVLRVLRQVRWWRRIAVGSSRVTLMDDNLAVGVYPAAVCDPTAVGAGFVMHADGPRNGELRIGADGAWAPAVLGVQNVPIHYVAVVREHDVLLGVSSLPDAHGLGPHPAMRPLALVPRPAAESLYAAVHQSLLGQIGFRADTRIGGVRVARLPEAAGPAVAGGAGAHGPAAALFAGRRTAVGDDWRFAVGAWLVTPESPPGLIRVTLEPASLGTAGFTVAFRARADGQRWELNVSPEGARLHRRSETGGRQLAAESWAAAPSALQILDDGNEVSVLAPDRLLFGRRFVEDGDAPAVSFGLVDDQAAFPPGLLAVESLPRSLPIPDELVAGAPWLPASGVTAVADPLRGEPGDLAGRSTPVGGRLWRRLFGAGRLEVTGDDGARWSASVTEPLPGRTIYAIDWDDPEFAELEVTLTPPGTGRGQREHGTSGFCLWQDADNHLLVNTWLDDCYAGASLSSFFTLDGFEDLYDAIWTNVGERVTWGRPLRLKLVSDGLRYTVFVDGEPVLHRSLADVYPGRRPLRIRKVGLLGNWEWGADTGSRFADFRAAGRAPTGT